MILSYESDWNVNLELN